MCEAVKKVYKTRLNADNERNLTHRYLKHGLTNPNNIVTLRYIQGILPKRLPQPYLGNLDPNNAIYLQFAPNRSIRHPNTVVNQYDRQRRTIVLLFHNRLRLQRNMHLLRVHDNSTCA
ncbi:MAG: hypothetical protein LBH04_12565 [Tannerellaceae bacterium]|nr:hypothetical protein [Tannerellaceae bacterium]